MTADGWETSSWWWRDVTAGKRTTKVKKTTGMSHRDGELDQQGNIWGPEEPEQGIVSQLPGYSRQRLEFNTSAFGIAQCLIVSSQLAIVLCSTVILECLECAERRLVSDSLFTSSGTVQDREVFPNPALFHMEAGL